MHITDITFATYGRKVSVNRVFPARDSGINKLYYINSGTILCKTPSEEYVLKKGHLYLIPQQLDIVLTASKVDHTFFDFFTAPIIMNSNIIDIDILKFPMIEAHLKAVNLFVEKYPMYKYHKDSEYYNFAKNALKNLLMLINEEFDIITVSDSIINKAIEYIHGNYFKQITVSELADIVHLEKGSFIRRFKKFTNTTPYKYIKNLRVSIALSLVKEGNYTLSEIASLVGYSDAATLSHSMNRK